MLQIRYVTCLKEVDLLSVSDQLSKQLKIIGDGNEKRLICLVSDDVKMYRREKRTYADDQNLRDRMDDYFLYLDMLSNVSLD